MKSVGVALIGVGNCAASVVQAWAKHKDDSVYPGGIPALANLGPLRDLRFTAAFDVDARKIGADLSAALWMPPNNAPAFADVPPLGVAVHAGLACDGLGPRSSSFIDDIATAEPDAVVRELRRTGTDVVVSLLPAGADEATAGYAAAALRSGCAFVNCSSTVLARDEKWRDAFSESGLPLIGDDLKAQLGATIVHQTLVRLLSEQGVTLDRTYQINAGGNMNFVNLGDPARSRAKSATKVHAVTSEANRGAGLASEDCYAGMADFIPSLRDRKVAYIRLEGRTLGDQPVDIELRMDVPDSVNGAGAALDATRLAALALRSKSPQVTEAVNALQMKESPVSLPAGEALETILSAHGSLTAADREVTR